jgi:hypothetical protein
MSTSSNEQRFRTFGDTFGKGAPAFLHVADTGVVFTNADGQPQTGAWRAATPSDIAGQAGAYTSVISGLQNTSIGTIPAGSLYWSLILQQGSVSLNGSMIETTGVKIEGGGNGGRLSSAIPYGSTGSRAIITYDI